MRRVSDTGIVRNYCQNNVGGVFDLNYLSKHNFSDIPNVNLRKIVTRFIDQGILRQVSKGVYLIGESDMSDEDRIIKHYLKDGGLPIGEYLLYTLGIIEEEPIEKTIKTNLSVGNKKIGNIQVIESHSSFYEIIGAKKLITVLEILTMMNEIASTKVLEVSSLIEEYLTDYRDSSFEAHVNDEYSRSVYLRLASILDSMNKPHNVMGIYVSKAQV